MEQRQPDSSSTAPRRQGRWRLILMLALIAAALVVPRVVALRGVETASVIGFADMADHLYFLDLVSKEGALSPAQQQDPFLLAFPETRPRRIAVQWPRGLYRLAALWAPALGTGSVWTTQVTNLLFTLVLLGAVIGLGHSLAGLRVGLWAALLTALNPALVAATWYFSLDFPMLAMALLALYLLLLSRGYRVWWSTVAFALAAALGCYLKPTCALYLVGPAAAALVVGLVGARAPGRRALVLVRCLVGAALGLGLLVLLYRPDWQTLGTELRVHFIGQQLPGSTGNPWTAEWLLTNLKFAAVSYPWPLLLLALPGLLWLHFNIRRVPARWALLTFLWAAYLLLTILSTKMERYAQPAYPVLCLLTAWAAARLPPPRWRLPALAGAAAAFAVLLGVTHLHPTPWLPEAMGARSPESAYNPFRYELAMPGQARLERLRRLRWDTECDLRRPVEVMQQLIKDHAPAGRPLGAAHLRDAARPIEADGAMLFRRLVPALTLAAPDRYLLVGSLHGAPDLWPPLRHVPALLLLHAPDFKPEARYPGALRLAGRREATYTCRGSQHTVHLSLTLPLQPLPGDAAAASPGAL